jgi:hypothetical protein
MGGESNRPPAEFLFHKLLAAVVAIDIGKAAICSLRLV